MKRNVFASAAEIMKMVVVWVVAQVIALMIGAVRSSERSLNLYQATRRNNPKTAIFVLASHCSVILPVSLYCMPSVVACLFKEIQAAENLGACCVTESRDKQHATAGRSKLLALLIVSLGLTILPQVG
jgi:hypothetical protein